MIQVTFPPLPRPDFWNLTFFCHKVEHIKINLDIFFLTTYGGLRF